MNKIEKLQNFLRPQEAVLIFSEPVRYYFTGHLTDSGVLAVTKNKAVFYTDFRYIEEAKAKIKDCEALKSINFYSQINEFLKSLNITKAYTEPGRITISQFSALRKVLDKKIVLSKDKRVEAFINSLRAVKSEEEQRNIIKAQKLTDETFEYIIDKIVPGKTEKEIMLDMEFYIRKLGSEGVSFDFIVVSGKNTSLPHGKPTDKKIEKGDFITMDFGAVVNGLHSDMTRTVAVGYASEEMKTVYNTVLKAQTAALDILKPGLKCNAADKAARDIIDSQGYSGCFGHALGHSLGYEIHESPTLSPKCTDILKPGNAVTVEPGIYIENKFGVRIEDTVFITENGITDITKSPKELIIL